jgi:hypothetical protein
MNHRTSSSITLGLLGGLAISVLAGVGIAQAVPSSSPYMPLSEVKAGMKGYGLTVMSGTKPEKFDVEIIGTLSNFRPNQALILIKTPNHPRLDIAHTVAGMSGSPIYLEGKMIGAYAYGWTFGAEPIAGVTPIHNMLEDLKKPIPPLFKPRASILPKHKDASKPNAVVSQQSQRAFSGLFDNGKGVFSYDLEAHAKQLAQKTVRERGNPNSTTTTLAPASTPILIGGLTPGAMAQMEQMMGSMGLMPLQAGGGGATKTTKGAKDTKVAAAASGNENFVDGGAIGVQLIKGDVSAMGLGTVTRVEGDKLVAFGHPMMGGGASDMPTAVAKVHWILASTNRSFKIGEAVQDMGTMVNDRQASIVVDTKRVASTFPVSLKIEGVEGAPKTQWDSEVSQDPFMAPFLAAAALSSAVETTSAERGDTTWRINTKVKVAGYGTIELRDFGASAGDGGDPYMRSRVVRALGMLLNNPWEDVRVEGVESKLQLSFERDVALMRGTSLVQQEVDPGQPVRIKIELVPFKGKPETRVIEVPIPADFAGEEVMIDLSPGYEIERYRAMPESVADLVALLNNPSFPEESLVATIRLKGEGGAAFRNNVAYRLPPGAMTTLSVGATPYGPETFGSLQQTSHPMKTFVVGRDRVNVRVRPLIK